MATRINICPYYLGNKCSKEKIFDISGIFFSFAYLGIYGRFA